MPFRLQIYEPDSIPAEIRNQFVHRTLVDTWKAYLANIQGVELSNPLRANIAHRLQAAEFEAALILRHKNTGQSLMETIYRFKIHYFCILANSILEGIGSSIYRNAHGPDPCTHEWQEAIASRVNEPNILANIQNLTQLRNGIHIDRVREDEVAQFNLLDYVNTFVPSYCTFRSVLSHLNPEWPDDCVLNEDIPTGGEGFACIP